MDFFSTRTLSDFLCDSEAQPDVEVLEDEMKVSDCTGLGNVTRARPRESLVSLKDRQTAQSKSKL